MLEKQVNSTLVNDQNDLITSSFIRRFSIVSTYSQVFITALDNGTYNTEDNVYGVLIITATARVHSVHEQCHDWLQP